MCSSSSSKKLSPFRRAIPQVIAVSIKNILLLGFGTSVGFPTILIGAFTQGKNSEGFTLSQDYISWISSVSYLCNPIGSILSGIVTQIIGRRRSMQLVNIPYLTAWLLLHYATQPWQILTALALIGFSGGLLEAPILTYVAEITEPRLRGALSSTSSVSINLGILVAFILGTFNSWRTVAAINASIPIVAMLMLTFVPESPYWLISQHRLDEAQKSLAWLRGWSSKSDVHQEYLRLYENLQRHPMKGAAGAFSFKKARLYFKLSFLKPFFLISFTFILSHFWSTPLNVYAIKIFGLFNISIGSYYATIYIGIVELVAVIVCVFAVKFLGKRLLMAISLGGVFLCVLATGMYCHLAGANNFNDTINDVHNWVPLVTILGQAFFTYLCIKSLPWIFLSELYNNDVRGFGSGFSSATGYVFGFAANKSFLGLVTAVGLPGVMWMYSGLTLSGLVALYFIMPETEGKAIEDISEHYSGGRKLDNRVFKKRMRAEDEAC